MHIPPSTILSGLGHLSSEDAARLVAVFQDAKLWNLAKDKVQDLASGKKDRKAERAFETRLNESARIILASAPSDAVIRLRLWASMRDAFNLPPALPYSLRAADRSAARLGQNAAHILESSLLAMEDELDGAKPGLLSKWLDKIKNVFLSRPPLDFNRAVGLYAIRLLADDRNKVSKTDMEGQTLLLLERLEKQPPEQRAEAIQQALRQGDVTLASLLASGGTLAGLGIAVELAGFSAYILAAQASSILPLVSGKTLVSTLFVLANPLFLFPALLGGGWWANRRLSVSIGQRLAASTVIMLALGGVARREGLKTCLDGFRGLTPADIRESGLPHADDYADLAASLQIKLRGPVPPAPVIPPGFLADPPPGEKMGGMELLLRDPAKDDAIDAGIVAGLTLGDIFYTAASIDPVVVAAADFSRSADLADLFRFGAFAEDAAEKVGAVTNLKGYVAEQMVAARLVEQGHQVTFPDVPNAPGFDLLVDGSPFQVKCLKDPSGLTEHFEKYPDIPVFANAELADMAALSQAEWSDRVFFLEGYSEDMAQDVTDSALSHGAELLDLDVPIFAVAVSAARNLYRASQGSLSLSELPFEVAMDMAVRGGVSVVGGFAGQTVGLLIFGPAGAVVFGGTGGVAALFGAGKVRELLDRKLDPKWAQEMESAAGALALALDRAMRHKRSLLKGKMNQLPKGKSPSLDWLRARLEDDRVFLLESLADLDRIDLNRPLPAARSLCRLVYESGVHPWAVRQELDRVVGLLASPPSGWKSILKKSSGLFAGWTKA